MAQLPLDVLINIFSLIPLGRDRRDISALTLYNCLAVNSLFAEAASLPFLWKPHYQIRYKYSDDLREQARSKAVDGNWRLMYNQRREIDRAALKLLDRIVTTRVGLQAALADLVRQYLDVWDVLELETTCPIPAEFEEESSELDGSAGEKVPQHAICRRYWAKNIRDTIARGYGVTIWRKFKAGSDILSFELAMSSISTVFGVSDKEITSILDDLGVRCRRELVRKGIVVDKMQVDYDLRAICIEICVFMHKEGFTRDLGTEPNMLNKFPHAYLTTHRVTIPISLVHIFVAISTRLGIEAFPVNFPGVVMSYVPAHEPGRPPLIVNPSSLNPHHSIVDDAIPADENPVWQMQTFHPWLQAELFPCTADAMLIRTCRNIASSFRATQYYIAGEQDFLLHAPTLLLICIVNLISEEEEPGLRWFLYHMNLRPLDCIFILDELAPHLQPRRKQFLEQECAMLLDQEKMQQQQQHKRKRGSQFFIGMPVLTSTRSGRTRTGFIAGWDEEQDATEIMEGSVQSGLPMGDNTKVMVDIFSTDGTRMYLPTESIIPATFTLKDIQYMYHNFETFPIRFEGVDLPKDPVKGVEHPEGRGRLLLSPHAKHQYPADSDIGTRWVEDGVF